MGQPHLILNCAFSQLLMIGGRTLTHCHNLCISSLMKLKLDGDIIWVMLTSKFMKKANDIIIFMTCPISIFQLPLFSSNQAVIWFRGRFWGPDFKFQLKKWIKCQVLMRKGILLLTMVKYCSNYRWSPWQQANIYT